MRFELLFEFDGTVGIIFKLVVGMLFRRFLSCQIWYNQTLSIILGLISCN